MCFRCEVCKTVTLPGEQRSTYPILRDAPTVNGLNPHRKEIAREVTVCSGCKKNLDFGISLAQLVKSKGVVVVRKIPEPPKQRGNGKVVMLGKPQPKVQR